MGEGLQTSLGTALSRTVPLKIFRSLSPQGSPKWKGKTCVARLAHAYSRVYTHARPRTTHTYTAPSSALLPRGRVSFSLKSRRSPRKPRLAKAPGPDPMPAANGRGGAARARLTLHQWAPAGGGDSGGDTIVDEERRRGGCTTSLLPAAARSPQPAACSPTSQPAAGPSLRPQESASRSATTLLPTSPRRRGGPWPSG